MNARGEGKARQAMDGGRKLQACVDQALAAGRAAKHRGRTLSPPNVQRLFERLWWRAAADRRGYQAGRERGRMIIRTRLAPPDGTAG